MPLCIWMQRSIFVKEGIKLQFRCESRYKYRDLDATRGHASSFLSAKRFSVSI